MLSRRGALAAGLALPAVARAQSSWPLARPIEVFVPFPAGGGVDTMVRGIVANVAPRLPGSRFVVTNRPGAGGQLGFEANFNAAADGYTLGAATNTAMNAISIERSPRYRPAEFTWIANVVDDPAGFWVHPDSPWKNLSDLAAAAKQQPEAFGVGNISEAIALQRDGKIRALGVAAPARFAPLPAVPTFREQGFDFVAGASRGFIGTPGLPAEMRQRYEAAFTAALAEPAFLADAARLAMPLRPLIGGAYASMIAEMELALRALWQRHPWKES
jgi:tripartite-type tricarboxylate transporter receptor subunit TctC